MLFFIPRPIRGFLALAISALFVPGAMAGPDSCTASNGGSTLTCEGNQSQGRQHRGNAPNALVIQEASPSRSRPVPSAPAASA